MSRRSRTSSRKSSRKSSRRGGSSGAAKQEEAKYADIEDDPKYATNINLPKPKDFITSVAAMKVFPTMYESDVNDIKDTFDELIKLLKERKEACVAYAQERADKYKFDDVTTDPIKMDIGYITDRINRCGTTLGEGYYELERSKINTTDELVALNNYEEKLQYVGGDFTKTKSVKGLKNAIGKVEKTLAQTQPILDAAKEALKDITKASLDEIRALPKPNKLLVRTVKACALLIGTPEKELDGWKEIRKLLKTTFINNLTSFEGSNVNQKIVRTIEKDYLGRGNDDMKEDDKLTYDNVKKANSVAASLVKWLEAQLKFNEMLPQVTAKKAELAELQQTLALMDGSSSDLANAIKIMEHRVTNSKEKVRNLCKKEDKMETQFNQSVNDYSANQDSNE